MSATSTLAVDLTLLTDALAEPAADLALDLQILARSAHDAVRSCRGIVVTVDVGVGVGVGARPVRLVLLDPDVSTPYRASLHFRVPGAAGAPGPVTVTLVAGSAGAFVDLGADLAFLFDLTPAQVVPDRHLGTVADSDDAVTVADLTTVNRAVGVLVARGDDLESARAALDRSAATDHRTVVAVATTVLASVALRPIAPPTPRPLHRAGIDRATPDGGRVGKVGKQPTPGGEVERVRPAGAISSAPGASPVTTSSSGRFPVTSSDVSLSDAPIPLTAGHTVTRVLRTPQRCRSCGQWLSLDEDDLAALWEDPAAGVICWTCDQRDQHPRAVGP